MNGTAMPAMLARIKHLLIDPRSEWPLIAAERHDRRALLVYVAALAAIPAVAGFVGSALIGVSVSAGTLREPLLATAARAAISFVFSFAIVFLTALAIEAMAPLFGAQRNFIGGLKLAAYSFTPVWLIGIVLAFPGLRFLSVLGLYALRLLWTGLPPLKGAPRPRVLAYTIAIAVAAFGMTVAMAALQGALLALLFRR